METTPQTYRTVPIDTLTPHPANPRQGDVGAIHESITTNGFYGALIVQKATGYVLAGNHRLQAARHAGATEVPILEIDVDDDTATRILLADNRTNDLAAYDDGILANLLVELLDTPLVLAGTAFDADDLDRLLADLEYAENPTEEEQAGAPADVPDGYQRLTFTVPDDEAETIRQALEHARPRHRDEDVSPDAAALHLICAAYLTA